MLKSPISVPDSGLLLLWTSQLGETERMKMDHITCMMCCTDLCWMSGPCMLRDQSLNFYPKHGRTRP